VTKGDPFSVRCTPHVVVTSGPLEAVLSGRRCRRLRGLPLLVPDVVRRGVRGCPDGTCAAAGGRHSRPPYAAVTSRATGGAPHVRYHRVRPLRPAPPSAAHPGFPTLHIPRRWG